MLSDPVEVGQGAHQPRHGLRRPGRRPAGCGRLHSRGRPVPGRRAHRRAPPWPSTTWAARTCCSGDLVSALAHMDSVRPILLPLSPVGVAITNQDRAEVLMAAGLTRRGSGGSRRGGADLREPPSPTAPGRGRADHRPRLAGEGSRACAGRRSGRASPVRPHPDAGSAVEGRGAGPRCRGAAGADQAVPGGARRRPRRRAATVSTCARGRSTSGSTARWWCSAGATTRRRGAACGRYGSRRAHRSAYD